MHCDKHLIVKHGIKGLNAISGKQNGQIPIELYECVGKPLILWNRLKALTDLSMLLMNEICKASVSVRIISLQRSFFYWTNVRVSFIRNFNSNSTDSILFYFPNADIIYVYTEVVVFTNLVRDQTVHNIKDYQYKSLIILLNIKQVTDVISNIVIIVTSLANLESYSVFIVNKNSQWSF